MTGRWYAVLCVLGPAAWGVLMYAVFGWLRRLRPGADARRDDAPVDYTI